MADRIVQLDKMQVALDKAEQDIIALLGDLTGELSPNNTKDNDVKKAKYHVYKRPQNKTGTRVIYANYKGKEYKATLHLEDFSVTYKGTWYASVSTAGQVARKGQRCNGWVFWFTKTADGYKSLELVFPRKRIA